MNNLDDTASLMHTLRQLEKEKNELGHRVMQLENETIAQQETIIKLAIEKADQERKTDLLQSEKVDNRITLIWSKKLIECYNEPKQKDKHIAKERRSGLGEPFKADGAGKLVTGTQWEAGRDKEDKYTTDWAI
jgi:hypothetical protein